MLTTLEPRGILDHFLHKHACQHCLTIDMRSSLFLMDEALLNISPVGHGRLVKILITFEPHGIFGSNFAYLFILTLSNHWYAKR